MYCMYKNDTVLVENPTNSKQSKMLKRKDCLYIMNHEYLEIIEHNVAS